MAALPPLTDRLDTFRDVLVTARARWKEAWRMDPRDGCMEPPTLEFGSLAVLGAAGLALLLALSSFVTLFLTRGPVLWVQAGAMVVLGGWALYRLRRNCAAVRRRRRESAVTTGAVVMANDALFDPASDVSAWGVALVVTDAALAEDAEAVADLAERAYAEWRTADLQDLPEELRAAARHVCQDVPLRERVEVPESWAGRRGVWVSAVYFERAALPRRVIDRRVMPFAVHPSQTLESVEPLPAPFFCCEYFGDLPRLRACPPARTSR